MKPETTEDIKAWADRLERNNIERVVIYTYAFGNQFEELYDKFKSVSDKFEMFKAAVATFTVA